MVSVWICPSTADYKQDSIIEVRADSRCVYGNVDIDADDTNLFQIVVLNLNDKDEKSDEQIIRLLSVLLSDDDSPEERKKILEDEFGIPMTEEFERSWNNMCDLSEAVKMKSENEVNVRVATEMLKGGEDYGKIEKYSHLTAEKVQKLAQTLGLSPAAT